MDNFEEDYVQVKKSWCIYDIILSIILLFTLIATIFNVVVLFLLHRQVEGDMSSIIDTLMLEDVATSKLYKMIRNCIVSSNVQLIFLGVSLVLLILSFILYKMGRGIEFYKDKIAGFIGILTYIGSYVSLIKVNGNLKEIVKAMAPILNMQSGQQLININLEKISNMSGYIAVSLVAIGTLLMIYAIFHIIDYAIYLLRYEC